MLPKYPKTSRRLHTSCLSFLYPHKYHHTHPHSYSHPQFHPIPKPHASSSSRHSSAAFSTCPPLKASISHANLRGPTFDFIPSPPATPPVSTSPSSPRNPNQALEVLQKYHGYDSFRGRQEMVIHQLENPGARVLYMIPTGGGKSLIYQVLARLIREDGVIIVVEPLISLLLDQLQEARAVGLAAEGIHGGLTDVERSQVYLKIKNKQVRMIYATDNTLHNRRFLEVLGKQKIQLLVLDEAHKIPEDGSTYRKGLLWLPTYYSQLKPSRILLTTATATKDQIHDLTEAFQIPQEGIFTESVYRPNLKVYFEKFTSNAAKEMRLLQALSEFNSCQIVYTRTRKEAEDLSKKIQTQFPDWIVDYYHGGRLVRDKQRVQSQFMNPKQEKMIITATNAFGVGLNKRDIRQIIHYGIPDGPSSYVQEIGRAGRDGKPARCLTLIVPEDVTARARMIRSILPIKSGIVKWLEQILKDGWFEHGASPLLNTFQQAKRFNLDEIQLELLYSMLEYHQPTRILKEAQWKPTTFLFTIPGRDITKLETLANVKYPNQPENAAIIKHARQFSSLYSVDLLMACKGGPLIYQDVDNRIQDFGRNRYINIRRTGTLIGHRSLVPAFPQDIESLAEVLHRRLDRRVTNALEDYNKLLNGFFGTHKTCFTASLVEYYGFKLPQSDNRCGHCFRCAPIIPPLLEYQLPETTVSKKRPKREKTTTKTTMKPIDPDLFLPIPNSAARRKSAWGRAYIRDQDKFHDIYQKVLNKVVSTQEKGNSCDNHHLDAEFLANYAYGIPVPQLFEWRWNSRASLCGSMSNWTYKELLEGFKLYIDAQNICEEDEKDEGDNEEMHGGNVTRVDDDPSDDDTDDDDGGDDDDN